MSAIRATPFGSYEENPSCEIMEGALLATASGLII